MDDTSIKKLKVYFWGLIAGLCVLALVAFLPVENTAVMSVGEEVERRMTHAVAQEQLAFIPQTEDASKVSSDHPDQPDGDYAPLDKALEGSLINEHQQVETVEDDLEAAAETPTASSFVVSATDQSGQLIRETTTSLSEIDGDQQASVAQVNENQLQLFSVTSEPEDDPSSFDEEAPLVLREVSPPEVMTPTTVTTPEPTEAPTLAPTMAPTGTATSLPTETPAPTPAPTQTLTPVPTDSPDIFWQAGFETGDISEWTAHGDWLRQGNTATYQVQTKIVKSGEYAVQLTIDTSSGSSQAAYLFYWDQLPNAAYYSAWYYIPANIDTEDWWNVMQWKSTYNGDSDYSRPVFVLDGAIFGQTALSLCYLPDRDVDKQCWKQTTAALPQDQWVHIEVYYERDKVDGHVIVWQDGVKLFDITGYPTVLSDGTLYYSVNHYTDGINPDVSSIYIDDVVISYDRVWGILE